MWHDPKSVGWRVHLADVEHRAAVQDALHRAAYIDRRMESVSFQFSANRPVKTVREYYLRDYFSDIRVADPNVGASLDWTLTFFVRAGANRFWKDAMVAILREVRDSAPSVSITDRVPVPPIVASPADAPRPFANS